MNQTLKFTKMHGAGNDYVYVNGFVESVSNPEKLAERVSNRNFGIGSDGLVLILPSSVANVRMRMFNPDGSEAQMCGNATRCVAKYAADHGLAPEHNVVTVETMAGIRTVRLLREGSEVVGATVDMGEPVLEPKKIPMADGSDDGTGKFVNRPVEVAGTTRYITGVSMGNPHAVIFLTDADPALESLDLPAMGPAFENHPIFPERTNTEFVRVESPDTVSMRVWERGTGETLACGTGACATAVACILNGHTGRTVDVRLRGGTLRINWNEQDNHVYMTGPAVTVFDGVLYL